MKIYIRKSVFHRFNMIAEITSPELLDIVSSSTENGSEIDPSQNGKKVSYSNLEKQVASLKKRRKHY